MPKNLFQDMVKVKRERRAGEQKTVSPRVEKVQEEERQERIFVREPVTEERETYVPRENVEGGGRRMLWVVAGVAVLFFLFALSFLFSSATVTVSPKIKDITLNDDFSAVKDITKEDDLPFEVVVITGQEQKTVQGKEMADVSTPAKGAVVLYNNFSTTSQKLDINTRLEGSNGKIYKTEKVVTVPGMKGATPGSVEVNVYGSEGGDSYNSAPLDFKILGFKGTPKYEKFYARSKGPLAGGFVGKSPTLSDPDKMALHNSLKLALQDSLVKKAKSQIPDGFILFNDAVSLNTETESFGMATPDGSVLASMKGTLYGVLFNEQKLTGKIAQAKVENYDGSDIFIPNLKDLTFLLASTVDATNMNTISSVDFHLSGKVSVVYKVDEAQLRADLVGKSKKDFGQVLGSYPDIDSADTRISPFWKMSFPDSLNKIKVIVNYPK